MRSLFLLVIAVSFFSCAQNNVDVDQSLEKYFTQNNVDGCFGMLNNKNGRITVYNLERYRDSAYLPASTFKIVNALIGLQTGVISNDSMVIKWDGVTRSVPGWNRDVSMYEAFRISDVPYFQEVARRIGKDTMQHWLDTLAYGSTKIKTQIDSFWLDGSLKITPDEQLGLVKQLYFYQLPFHKRNQQLVKTAMLMEDKPEYKLSYKTGLGTDSAGRQIGWVTGWIEENGHPYFFVLNLSTANQNINMPAVRMQILNGIVEQLGFKKGNK